MPQDKEEARGTVEKRLEFINKEMCANFSLDSWLLNAARADPWRCGVCYDDVVGRDVWDSERIENQLKEIGEKAEKKRSEVRLPSLLHSRHRQCIEVLIRLFRWR